MKKTPLKRISKKRQEQMKEYGKLREQYLAENTICEVCGQEPSTEIHHKSGRWQKTNDVSLFMAVSRKCHNRIHFGEQIQGEYKYGPSWSRENGYLI